MGIFVSRATLVLLVFLVVGLVGAQSAPLATFTVTNTTDSGDGSLRQAILEANASSGADTITFAIDGSPPYTITLASALPTISDPVTIDGTTDPGFSGTPVIEINAAGVGLSNDGLRITAGSSTVRGLVINRAPIGGASIRLMTSGGNTIEGNYLGTNVAGTAAPGSNRGLVLESSPNLIGGDTVAERNVISGSTQENIRVDVGGNTIQGNYIGTDATGTTSLAAGPSSNGIFINGGAGETTIGGTTFGQGNLISGNGSNGIQSNGSDNLIRGNLIGTNAAGTAAVCNAVAGIAISSSATGNVIGGIDSGARNVISGNCGSGINLSGSGSVALGNTIEANFIGTDVTGTSAVPNAGAGIKLQDAGEQGTRNTVIGGIGTASANVIAMNGGAGVEVVGPATRLNTIRSNSIFQNGGLGIDLAPAGPTANDPPANLDADLGPNDLQNFPVLNPDLSTTTEVAGELDSAADEDYQIEVYSTLTCVEGDSEGKTRVASFQVTTNASGHAAFGEQPLSPAASGFLTATATHLESKNTSEFSSCIGVGGGGGGGSLTGGRAAGSGNYDLTTEGTADWAVWGFSDGGEQCNTPGACSTSLSPDVRKTEGSGISDLVNINPGPAIPLRGIGFVPDQPFTFAWEDGSPLPSETNARTGLQHNGEPPTNQSTLGTGFGFTVPADTTPRTLKVWVAQNRAGGQFTATLSDGSAAPFSDSFDVGIGDFVGSVYTLTYQAASAEETLNVSWVENVDNCVDFRCDNVSIHAVALAGPTGGEAPDPPVLFGAVPDVPDEDGPTLGVAGVWDAGFEPDGTVDFDVDFYSVETCSPEAEKTTLGSAAELETNDGGIGAFAIDGLTNVGVGTLVVATVTEDETPSAISNCVIADRFNTSWPTARETTGEVGDNFLRSSGQSRWFKVPVDPNSRLDVHLTGLPADYDLVVFRDIQKKYDALIGGAPANEGPNLALDDLNRDGADTPTDLFNTSQYNRDAWDPTNWKPDLNANVFTPQFSPTEYSPTEYSASFTSPTEYSPTEYSPTEYSPTEYSPTEYSPTEYSADQFSRDPWASFNPGDPRAFTTAQTASLVAVSAGAGTGDETVSVNTWNNTGHFYVRVQGKNGSFDADSAFSLAVTRTGNVCSGVSSEMLDEATPFPANRGHETLILWDSTNPSNRWPSGTSLTALEGRLSTLATQTDGVVVNVGADTVVTGLNAQADGAPGCPFAKNLVAARLKQIVDAHRSPDLKYVVVVGGDNVIPFFRYPDPALLGNETLYVPPVRDATASQASLRLGYVLSDDFLASSDQVSLHGNDFPVPDVAIGRLVETPSEIVGVIDAYLGATSGVSPTSSLVTGYDFLTDSARQISGRFDNLVGAANNEALITNQGISPAVTSDGANQPEAYYNTRSWTATDLRRELLGAGGEDLIFLAGHFSANDALAADYRTNVLTTELTGAAADLTNSVVFSAGCHSGYNLVNEHGTTVTQPLDWAQAFAQKRATLIAGTGYQYGDTDFIAHSERLYVNLAQELGGDIGSSLLRAKQRFLEDSPGLSALDEKALLQTTLFGLPMLRVNVTPASPPGEPPAVTPSPVEGGPGGDLGLASGNVSVTGPSGSPSAKSLNGLTGPATWFGGSDGLSLKPMQPVLPLESLNATAAGRALRGVLFLGGSYEDTPNTNPLTAAPATELRGIHSAFQSDVFFPPQPWSANYFGALSGSGNTQFHVTPVQHRSESPTMTRRKFTGMDFRLFYSSNTASYCGNRGSLAPCTTPGQIAVTPALSAPPTITGVDTTHSGNVLTFMAHVLGDNVAGIQSAWVTYTNPPGGGGGGGAWQSIQLQQDDEDPTLWTGTLTTSTPGAIDFMVQAVSGVGKVTLDNNLGAFYTHGSIPGPLDPGEDPPTPTLLAFTSGPPASVAYKQSFNVTVALSSSAGCTVGGRRIDIGLGGAGLPATTNAGGQATVTLTASLPPGTYPVTASFAGTSACRSSDVSADIVVTKQPTSLAIAFPVVTLTASTTPQPTPLHDRTVIVSVLQGGVTRLTFVGRTDPLGRVRVPPSLLAALPQGSYTVVADFDGDEGYAEAVATAGNGLNVIRRGTGSDRITGTDGSDLIVDAGGSNTVDGRGGNDIILMLGSGSHTVVGGTGDDWIETGSGSDKIDGGAGNDTIHAGDGSNDVTAGSGDDLITAGRGSDKVNGGVGFDVCHAGGGSNTVTNCEA